MIGGSVIKGYISEHDEDKMKFECTSNEVILGTISKDEIDSITKCYFDRLMVQEIKYLS